MRHLVCCLAAVLVLLVTVLVLCQAADPPMVGNCYTIIPPNPHPQSVNMKTIQNSDCDHMNLCMQSAICDQVLTSCPNQPPKPFVNIESGDLVMVGICNVRYNHTCQECPAMLFCARFKAYDTKDPFTGECTGACPAFAYEGVGPNKCKK